MLGRASRRMVGWFAVGPVVPLLAPARSFWWVVVPVVRLCVAVSGRVAVAAMLVDGCVVVVRQLVCSSMGPPRWSQWLTMRPHRLVRGVVVAVLLHVPVRIGDRSAAGCAQPRQGSTN